MSNQENEDITSDLGKKGQQSRKHGTLLLGAGKLSQGKIEPSTSATKKKAVLASKTKTDADLS